MSDTEHWPGFDRKKSAGEAIDRRSRRTRIALQEGAGKRWGSSRKGKLGLLEPTIGNRCPDLQSPMGPGRRPTHLPLLVHPSV
ncbi:MAG: hypothetical protein Q8K28_00790, partial [Hoeflea sp.]|uniref:hypothetical protein n=1 Tax=Hoeflea sp. TaxID=1940281 RepID=UPI00272F160F